MKTLQKMALHARKRMTDDKLARLENERLRDLENEQIAQSRKEAENQKQINLANEAKEKEIKKRRESIDKEIAYLEDTLDQINQEIQNINTPVVIDFTNDIEVNSKNNYEANIAVENYRNEIYDKQSYSIGKFALFSLKVAVAMILATIVGKLSATSPELVESMVAFTYFADMESVEGLFGLFLDFLSQEFFLVFVTSSALALVMRNEPYIHNQKLKYISIWIIIISMITIILLSTL